jgi:peptidoglycan hydrolase FlgJ
MNTIDLNTSPIVEQAKSTENIAKQKQADQQKIKKACKDFESIFTYYLLKTMRETVPKGTSVGSSSGKDTYYMLMDQKVSEEMSNKGTGLGLQKILYEQLTKNYSKEVPPEKIK